MYKALIVLILLTLLTLLFSVMLGCSEKQDSYGTGQAVTLEPVRSDNPTTRATPDAQKPEPTVELTPTKVPTFTPRINPDSWSFVPFGIDSTPETDSRRGSLNTGTHTHTRASAYIDPNHHVRLDFCPNININSRAYFDSYSRTDTHTHTNANPHPDLSPSSHTNTDPDSNTNSHASSHTNARSDPDLHANSHPHANVYLSIPRGQLARDRDRPRRQVQEWFIFSGPMRRKTT